MNLATFIFVSVPLAIQFYSARYRQEDHSRTLQEVKTDFGVPRIRTFDFIVVGAGTAGCVVAGRLSEAGNSVLLLETGGTPPPAVDVPAFQREVRDAHEINQFFDTIPQMGANGRSIGGSSGMMLGGSGAHHGMVHSRGSPLDYDNIADITDDPTWTYENVLPYFKRYEDFIGVLYDEGDEDAYGYGGPLTVDTYSTTPFLPLWLEAGLELRYSIGDPNARQRESFTPVNMMTHRGKRVTSYTGFIKPFEDTRPNLMLLRYSDVQELLINGSSMAAYGVAYKRHGIEQRAYASKEVIISAGVHRSPLLLMKSGIGPSDVLEAAGIPVKLARPGVGANLNEHIRFPLDIYFNDSSVLGRIHDGDEDELEEYHETGGGLLGEPFSAGLAFLVSNRARQSGESDWPDIQIQNSIRGDVGPRADGAPERVVMQVVNMRARQRGNLVLNATAWVAGERDDMRLAITDLQHLSDESDLDVIIDGIRIGLAAFEDTTAFKEAGVWFPEVPDPRCGVEHEFRSDGYWKCLIRWESDGLNHRTGTCKMGKADDPLAVVDSKLRVIGVQGLRVIDASVLPVLPNSNINAPTLMLAEKGAADILLQHL